MFQGFKEFITKGNVIDLAVAVVIGGAFTAIVNAVVSSIINPIVALFYAPSKDGVVGPTVTGLYGQSVTFPIGDLITAIISFFAVAVVVYAIFVPSGEREAVVPTPVATSVVWVPPSSGTETIAPDAIAIRLPSRPANPPPCESGARTSTHAPMSPASVRRRLPPSATRGS